MSSTTLPGQVSGLLSRERTVAGIGFSRWMVPPAALCVHLCIGQAYAFSVFNLPMTRLIGITQSAPDDWKLTDLGWIFSIAIFFLGASAAVMGRWVEEGGPRRAMVTAGLCWAGGFLVSALGVYVHNIWLVYLGYGVLGGCGLGIGYISPVSTLIRWFPDRPGMATGMAIMGFGGGAFIASPLSVWLMRQFSTDTHVGVAETFIVLGVIYLCFMMVGAAIVRLPPPGWAPAGYVPPSEVEQAHHHKERVRLSGAEDTAVLADLGGAVPERDSRHRRAWPGIGDEPGDVPRQGDRHRGGRLRRPDEPVQHGRPVLLGLGVGLHRPQEHLLRVLLPGRAALFAGAADRRDGQRRAVRAVLLCHHEHVWRRLRHRAGLPARHVRHALCRRDPRHAAHRMVDGRHLRACAGELHPAIQHRARRGESRCLRCHHVCHGGAAGGRVLLQPVRPGGARAASHARTRKPTPWAWPEGTAT